LEYPIALARSEREDIFDIQFDDFAKETEIFLYPNPAKNLITLHTIKAGELDIYNFAGNRLGQYNLNGSTKVNISLLKQGLYFCKFIYTDGSEEHKMFTILR